MACNLRSRLRYKQIDLPLSSWRVFSHHAPAIQWHFIEVERILERVCYCFDEKFIGRICPSRKVYLQENVCLIDNVDCKIRVTARIGIGQCLFAGFHCPPFEFLQSYPLTRDSNQANSFAIPCASDSSRIGSGNTFQAYVSISKCSVRLPTERSA